jgi:hypothetical protein
MYECYAIGASLAVVSTCSAIWVDTKIPTLFRTRQLTLTLVRPVQVVHETVRQ